MDSATIQPVVNLPCTVMVGTDEYPAKVVAVSKSAAKVTIQRDNGSEPEAFHRNASGRYVRGTRYLDLGEARRYMDRGF